MKKGQDLVIDAVPGMSAVMGNLEWHKQAACRGMKSNVFIFENNPANKVKKAKKSAPNAR